MTMMIRNIFRKVEAACHKRVETLNGMFNRLPKQRQKSVVIVFGICITVVSVMLILNSASHGDSEGGFKTDEIAMPYDIFMEDERGTTEDQLTPVGKMKGEIDGEFESFYVAVDNQGAVYINRDIEYSERAYDKTDDWKQISREKLMEYERELHFLPSQSKGVRR